MLKFIIINIIILVLYVLAEIYANNALKSFTENWNLYIRKIFFVLYWSITIATVIMFMGRGLGYFHSIPPTVRSFVSGLFISFVFFKMVILLFYLPVDLFNIAKWSMFKFKSFFNIGQNPGLYPDAELFTRSKFLKTTAVLTASIPFLASLNGVLRNPYRYIVHTIKVPIKNLPASFEGFTITQISDIHSGSLADHHAVAKGIEMVNNLKSDVIFFTGDLVNDMTDEVESYKELFSTLKAPMGVYSVTGNHDYGDYVQWESKEAKEQNLARLIQTHKDMGWDILMNEHRIIKRGEDKLAIIGIENWGGNLRFPKYGKMHEAYKGAEDAQVQLLLSHDPSHWDMQVRTEYPNIDLMFSGHTHGFQMGIETKYFKFSPSQWAYKQWAGLYQEGKQFLYVNRGFGFLGYPGRIGILPEITQLELVRG
jgi:hypothetical protein